mmetsp:Transcript_16438/g.27882  ORF Transcript_16438/g.27882 Transcript_16438/m.27882 type:complete len:382 (-) Transcript_16438:473-1618(-)
MLLKVGDELPGPNLPDPDLAFLATRDDKLLVVAECNCSHPILMSIVDLPELLAVVDPERSDLAVGPAGENDLVREERAHGVDVLDHAHLVDAPCPHAIVVRIPESNRPIHRGGDESFRLAGQVLNVDHWLGVVLREQHLAEVADPDSIEEALVGGRQHLHAILTRAEALDRAVELRLHERLAEILVDVEEHDLAVAAAHADLVLGHRLDVLDALGADRLAEDEHLVLHLEATEVAGLGAREEELLVGLGEGEAGVVAHHGPGLHRLVLATAGHGVKRPEGQLFRAGDGELVVARVPQLYVLDEAAPADGGDAVGEDHGRDLEEGDDVAVPRVPDEQLPVELVARGDEEGVVVGEGEVSDGVVVLGESEYGLFMLVVPNDDV